MRKSKEIYSSILLMITDFIVIVASYFLALHFKFILPDALSKYTQINVWINIVVAILLYFGIFFGNKIYRNIIIYASVKFHIFVGLNCLFSGFILTGASYIVGYKYSIGWKLNLLSTIFIAILTVGIRAFIKIAYITLNTKSKSEKAKKLLIIGAGSGGEWIIRSIKNSVAINYDIVGMIDDNFDKVGKYVHDIPVLATTKEIKKVCKEKGVQEILIAIPSLEEEKRQKIFSDCMETGLSVKTLPSISEIMTEDSDDAFHHIRDVNIEDLLLRKPINLNNEQLHNEINDKVVMVTGGGGSIGSELCRQIARHSPKKLIILDIYENNAYDLQMELNAIYPQMDLRVVIASVRDKKRIEHVFEDYRPNIVFHAAAHKHVPLMEYNPGESIKNNVFGTYNVALAADKYGSDKFVLISTDKAVNPTNIMGATKRICEMIVQSMQSESSTDFVAVRFGNVLGSNGSVIPLFKKQIENREPITVTHKEITRFFMTIPEAAQLVLQAACYAKGGEIFVLDMGQPVKIYDLAINLIRLSGLKPFEDIDIVITGLRPGEKLYEELLMNEEGLKKTENSKIFIGKPIFTNMETLRISLDKLEKAMVSDNKEYIKKIVAEVVPTYIPPMEKQKGNQPYSAEA